MVFTAVILTQVTPALNSAVCPGQDLVYSCNSTVSANVLWIERGDSSVFFSQATTTSEQEFTLGLFMIQVVHQILIDPVSIVSTATLTSALFSHNNTQIECFSLVVDPVLNDSAFVSVSGECILEIMSVMMI